MAFQRKKVLTKGLAAAPARQKMGRFCWALAVLLLSLALVSVQTQGAWAYFSLPGVSIAPSQSAVSVQSGQSQTISVSVSPLQESQLPGCGMAECPQTCPPDCIDANGWCVCGGTTYQTSYTQVSATSSNNSVARASFASGVLTVTGVSAGSATITIRASLAKHVDSAAYISVTVSAPSPGTTTPGGGSGGSGGSGGGGGGGTGGTGGTSSGGTGGSTTSTESNSSKTNSGTTTNTGSTTGSGQSGRTPVGADGGTGEGATTGKTEIGAATDASSGTSSKNPTGSSGQDGSSQQAVVRMTNAGGMTYTVVTLGLGANLAEVFSQAAGNAERIVVQQKDTVSNVIFSLSFFGADITPQSATAFNGSLEGALSDTLPEGVTSSGETLLLDFADHTLLPAAATVYVASGSHFASAAPKSINVYQVNPDDGKVTKIAQEGSVTDGYIVFDIDKSYDIILSTGVVTSTGFSQDDAGGPAIPPFVVIIIVGVIAVLVAAGVVRTLTQRKKQRAADANSIDEFNEWMEDVSVAALPASIVADETAGETADDVKPKGSTKATDDAKPKGSTKPKSSTKPKGSVDD